VKHLVNVSGGAGSAAALFRVIDRYGRENVSASLADTNSEHPDLYRFVDDLERIADIEIVRLKNGGLTIWDIFFREMMFTNPKSGAWGSMTTSTDGCNLKLWKLDASYKSSRLISSGMPSNCGTAPWSMDC